MENREDSEEQNVNIIVEVLSNAEEGSAPVTLPQPLAPADQVQGCATEVMKVDEEMDEPELTPAIRRSFRAQGRPSQAAITDVCARIVKDSPRVAKRAGLPEGAVNDLLATETGLGAVWRAAWPLNRYGLVRFRQSHEAIGQVVARINAAVAADPGTQVILMGQPEKVAARQDRSDQGKQTRRKKDRTGKAQAVAQNNQGLTRKRSAGQLAEDVTAGKARSRLPAPPANTGDQAGQGQSNKSKKKSSGQASSKGGKK